MSLSLSPEQRNELLSHLERTQQRTSQIEAVVEDPIISEAGRIALLLREILEGGEVDPSDNTVRIETSEELSRLISELLVNIGQS